MGESYALPVKGAGLLFSTALPLLAGISIGARGIMLCALVTVRKVSVEAMPEPHSIVNHGEQGFDKCHRH